MFKEVNVSDLKQCLADNKNVKIVDVRSPQEIATGAIAGSIVTPLHTLPVSYERFNKDDNIVFVCRSGARSAQATMFMQQQGFKNVCNLRGGMISWNQQAD